MKIKLKNVRISFPEIFKPGVKFNTYGGEFRFSAKSGIKEQLEEAINAEGVSAFGEKWPSIKESLQTKGKMLKVCSGKEKEYSDDFFFRAYNKARPEVRGRNAEVLTFEDRVIYSGCRVDIQLDVSAYQQKVYGPVVSVKLLSVQFRGDDEPLSSAPRAEEADFEKISDGADDDDL